MLDVGVYASSPFVVPQESGRYSGMAIELWEEAAKRLNLRFRYVRYATLRELVDDTAEGKVDVAVTNLTITRDRAEYVAFTQPWYDSGLRIMTLQSGSAGSFSDILSGLNDAGHLRAYAWLAAVILAATVGVTLFDRRFDPAFPRTWREGLAESFYHVMSIATTGRTARKNLFGWIGRIWQALWLLVGVGMIAYITSSVTSIMTAASLSQDIAGPADLAGHTVAVASGSTAEDYARDMGLAARAFPGLDEAVDALRANQVDAVIGDAPVLENYVHQHADGGLDVVGRLFHREKYGFAFPHGGSLNLRVVLELLDMQEAGTMDRIRRSYFGEAG